MSELTDRIIDDNLRQRPGARHAYHHDPTIHDHIERARSMLAVMESAMQREGIPYDSAERVLNEIVSTGLDGWERDKLSRERLLLLADMTADFRDDPFVPPSSPEEAERRMDREIAEHADCSFGFLMRYAAGLAPIDDTGPVRPDEEQTTCQHLNLSTVRESGDVGAVVGFTCTGCHELFDVEASAQLIYNHSVEAGRRWRADLEARGGEPTP